MKKLLFVKRHDGSSRRKSAYNKVIQVHHKALDAMMKGDKELLGDQKISLEDIHEICESKYDKHVIYSRVIFDFKTLKDIEKYNTDFEYLIS